MACRRKSYPGIAFARSPLPNAVTEHETSRGFSARSVSPSSPQLAMRPGRNDSIRMSARTPSLRASSRSSGSARSSTTERLLRFRLRKYVLSPSRHGGPQARVSSPPPGRSTLITSAPRSPSSIDA